MLGYLLLSYSGVPQTLLLPALPAVCMGEGGGSSVYLFIYLFFAHTTLRIFCSQRKKREIYGARLKVVFFFFYPSSGHIQHEDTLSLLHTFPLRGQGHKGKERQTGRERVRERG